jgi:hypothetical protein
MLLFQHPIWSHIRPHAHLSAGRDNLDFLQLTDELRDLALSVVANCVACGKVIHPLRARAKSERSRIANSDVERRLFYAPTCPTELNAGCSRTRLAQQHKNVMLKALGPRPSVIDGVTGEAWIEGEYRYNLTRAWQDGEGILVSIMLNPSTANAAINDPTLLRNIHFARMWGFAGLEVVNPFALRSPSPKALLEAVDPIGGNKNDIAIHYALSRASMILLGYGRPPHDKLLPRIKTIEERVFAVAKERGVPVVCLGRTQEGYPKHPLARGVHRVPDDQQPIPYGSNK